MCNFPPVHSPPSRPAPYWEWYRPRWCSAATLARDDSVTLRRRAWAAAAAAAEAEEGAPPTPAYAPLSAALSSRRWARSASTASRASRSARKACRSRPDDDEDDAGAGAGAGSSR
jgi:hypothetical protein